MTARKTVKEELRQASDDDEGPYVHTRPSLRLRAALCSFALTNDLNSEGEALAVVAARYFKMVESDRWAGWFGDDADKGDEPTSD
jgi:hypothetical protein